MCKDNSYISNGLADLPLHHLFNKAVSVTVLHRKQSCPIIFWLITILAHISIWPKCVCKKFVQFFYRSPFPAIHVYHYFLCILLLHFQLSYEPTKCFLQIIFVNVKHWEFGIGLVQKPDKLHTISHRKVFDYGLAYCLCGCGCKSDQWFFALQNWSQLRYAAIVRSECFLFSSILAPQK